MLKVSVVKYFTWIKPCVEKILRIFNFVVEVVLEGFCVDLISGQRNKVVFFVQIR